MTRLRLVWIVALTTGLPITLAAHVGSPDVYYEGQAGPYRLLVAIRTPPVVPGVAHIEVRVLEGNPHEVRVVPLRLSGPGAVFAPVPDLAARAPGDERFFTASLWMMVSGPWQVRVTVDGEGGRGQTAVPVDALASRTLEMSTGLALVMAPLAVFLAAGFIAIVGASVGQAQAAPGQEVTPARRRRAWIARAVAAVVVVTSVVLGNWWWGAEADAYARYIYKPIQIQPTLEADGRLRLRLRDPGWLPSRVITDLVPDHGHPMHLFLLRTPALDRLVHIHPEPLEDGLFGHALRSVEAGRYRLFADVVHKTGLPETLVSDIDLPARTGGLTGDDSAAVASSAFDPDRPISPLPDGGRIIWQREPQPIAAKRVTLLRFSVENADGQPARDLEPYMGMPGHAVFVKRDLGVFAHVHTSGTASMASMALAAATLPDSGSIAHTDHATDRARPAAVTFPYGFPQPGDYRIFVQIKRAGRVQTGIFDVRVERAP